MVSILKHKSILSIFPRLTNKFCNRQTNGTIMLLSEILGTTNIMPYHSNNSAIFYNEGLQNWIPYLYKFFNYLL